MINQLIIYIIVFVTLVYNISSFYKNRARFNILEQRTYSYLLISFSLWVSCNFLADTSRIYLIADFAARISLLFGLQVATAIYLISSVFPQQLIRDKSIHFWEKFIIGVNLALATIIILTLYTPLNIVTFNITVGKASSFVPGILYSVISGFSIAIFSFAFVRWYSRFYSYTTLQREQIKLLATTLTITIVSMVIGFIILPALNPALSTYSILAHVVIALFLVQIQINILTKNAIINYATIIQSATLYLTEFVLVLAVYYLVKYFETIGLDIFSKFLLIPLIFLLLSWLYNAYTIKYIQTPSRNYVKDFINKSTIMLSTHEVKSLLIDTIDKIMPRANVQVIEQHKNPLFAKISEHFLIYTSSKEIILSPETLIEMYLFAKQRNDQKHMKFYNEFVLELLHNHIDLIIPIAVNEEIHIILTVKNGIVPDAFSLGELKVLQQYASIALSRALLYEQVQNFANDLSDQVDIRTGELKGAQQELALKNKKLSRALAELQSVDKAKSDFISMASHQLRTPISIIFGYLSMIFEGDINGKVDEEKQKIIERVLQNIRQLNNVVEDILNTSRIEQGRLVINLEDVNVTAMTATIHEELRKKAEDKGLKLLLNVPANDMIVKLDKIKMHEVFMNIIDNAIGYTPMGSVTISLERKSGQMHFFVKDTGIGIPANQGKELFKRFSRLENAQRIRPDGSGIGLFTAKTIVEMHGGKIWFDSVEHKGTTFHITIP